MVSFEDRMNGDRQHNARIAAWLMRQRRRRSNRMAEHDPYEHDPGMKDLHQRDLRNRATPVHTPAVQHADFEAADIEAEDIDEGEGDAAFARSVADSVKEQEDYLASFDEGEGPVVDNTSPAGDDEPSPVNAYGNVAPDHAIENDTERPTAGLTAQGVAPLDDDSDAPHDHDHLDHGPDDDAPYAGYDEWEADDRG